MTEALEIEFMPKFIEITSDWKEKKKESKPSIFRDEY